MFKQSVSLIQANDAAKHYEEYQRTSVSSGYTVENIIINLKERLRQGTLIYTEDARTHLTRCEINLDNIHIPENAVECEGDFFDRLKKELKKLGICRVFRFWMVDGTLQLVIYITPKGLFGWLKHLCSFNSMECYCESLDTHGYHRFPETNRPVFWDMM